MQIKNRHQIVSYLKNHVPEISPRSIDKAIEKYRSATKRKTDYSALQAYFIITNTTPIFPAELEIGGTSKELYYVFGRIGLDSFRFSNEGFKPRGAKNDESQYLVADQEYHTCDPDTIAFEAIRHFRRLKPAGGF